MMNQKSNAKHPLVFIPGWGFHSSVWSTIADHFSQYPIYFLDWPRIDHFASFSMNEVTQALHSKLPPHATLIGWSFGGLIAMKLCSEYPKKCHQLVTISSLPKFSTSCDWMAIDENILTHFYEKADSNLLALQNQFGVMISHPERNPIILAFLKRHSIALSQKKSLLLYLKLLMMTDIRNLYQSLTIPTLQLFGNRDAIIPFAAAEQMLYPHTNRWSYIIDGAGHLSFLSHPSEFLRILSQFIKKEMPS